MSDTTPSQLPPAIFLMGPTGTGKTDLAVELYRKLPVDIISVDSALVYKGMDIGTAKPDQQTLEQAPHRLIDFLDPQQAYSAANFRADALKEMHDIHAHGRIPLLVGGTMLYFRALEHGLSELPAANPEIREQLEQEAAELGWQALHDQLTTIDPVAAQRIHPNDPQRLQRALEVYRITGQSMTTLQNAAHQGKCPFRLLKLAILPENRKWLHERLALRFNIMLEKGLLDEVKQLHQRQDLDISLPAIRSVGYRQVWEHLEGKLDYTEMRNRAIVATRQLAKRQITWLRSETNLRTYPAERLSLLSVTRDVSVFIDR